MPTKFAFVPDVISGRDEVDTSGKHLIGGLLGQAETAGGVFAVGDHSIDVVQFAREFEVLLEYFASRCADDIADDQQRELTIYDRDRAFVLRE